MNELIIICWFIIIYYSHFGYLLGLLWGIRFQFEAPVEGTRCRGPHARMQLTRFAD